MLVRGRRWRWLRCRGSIDGGGMIFWAAWLWRLVGGWVSVTGRSTYDIWSPL